MTDSEKRLAEKLGHKVYRDDDGALVVLGDMYKRVESLWNLCVELMERDSWIRIDPSNPETLPEAGIRLLVYNGDCVEPAHSCLVYTRRGRELSFYGADGMRLASVTHWSPLKAAPEEEK